MAANSGNTVSVACKLPHGLHLQLFKSIDGGKEGMLSQPIGPRVTLNGGNHAEAIAGWGLTENVDEEFMTKWLKDNHDMAAVANGLIIVRAKVEAVKSEAKNRKNQKTGFEAIDPAAKDNKVEALEKD